jgi:hypothetical protein
LSPRSPADDRTDAEQQHDDDSLDLASSVSDRHDPPSAITGGVLSTNTAGHASQDSLSMGAKADVAPRADMPLWMSHAKNYLLGIDGGAHWKELVEAWMTLEGLLAYPDREVSTMHAAINFELMSHALSRTGPIGFLRKVALRRLSSGMPEERNTMWFLCLRSESLRLCGGVGGSPFSLNGARRRPGLQVEMFPRMKTGVSFTEEASTGYLLL